MHFATASLGMWKCAARLTGKHSGRDCDHNWQMHQRPQWNADLHTTILPLHFWHSQCFMPSCFKRNRCCNLIAKRT